MVAQMLTGLGAQARTCEVSAGGGKRYQVFVPPGFPERLGVNSLGSIDHADTPTDERASILQNHTQAFLEDELLEQ